MMSSVSILPIDITELG